MTHSRIASALLVLCSISGCTTASETEVAAMGAALGGIDFAALPTLPPDALPTNPLPQPQAQICGGSPDLSVQALTANNRGYKDWLYVCTPVKNIGGATWTSNAAQSGVYATSNAGGSTAVNSSGFASMAVGSTVTRCGWMKVPHLLRTGHDEAKFGECQTSVTVTSQLSFDPDIRMDGNTANDDCRSTNNKRTLSVNYMAACPW